MNQHFSQNYLCGIWKEHEKQINSNSFLILNIRFHKRTQNFPCRPLKEIILLFRNGQKSMVFSLINNNMIRTKQPIQLYDRIINKGTKGLEELSEYMKKLAEELVSEDLPEERYDQISGEASRIVSYFIIKAKYPSNNESHRAYIVQSLETICFELEEFTDIDKHFKNIAMEILKYFCDISEKVRFTAIGSLYNLLNKYSEKGVELFFPTFQAVSQLITDNSGQVRQAAAYLNQTLKTMINDVVFDQKPFDLKGFIESLAEKIQTGGSSFKEFLLDWLMTIEEIPHFQLSFDLPLFFRQVFELLLSDSKNLRTKAQECLKKFLHVFRQILALEGCLTSKLRPENAQMLVVTILLLIRQNLSPEITLQSLQWLEMFTRFFSIEVAKKGESFLEPIYVSYFRDIILVIITTLSDDAERVRRTSQRINDALLQAFPTMAKDEKKMNETSTLLQKLLQENRLPTRVEAIFKWIILLLHQNTEQMLAEINSLLGHLVERLCDRNATRSLFLLLQGSIFVEDYFDLLVQTLLSYLSLNEIIPPEPIFRQLLSLDKAERNFLDVCRRVKNFENSRFQYRLLETLVTIFVSQPSLEGLRIKLEAFERQQIVTQLFECFCTNQAALVILGFLSQQYYFVIELFKVMAHWERLNDHKLRSLVRISNLIEHSNLNQLRTDLRKSGLAVHAYLSLLMALPHGKYHNLLLQRLPPQMRPLPQEGVPKDELDFAQNIIRVYQLGWKIQQKSKAVAYDYLKP